MLARGVNDMCACGHPVRHGKCGRFAAEYGAAEGVEVAHCISCDEWFYVDKVSGKEVIVHVQAA